MVHDNVNTGDYRALGTFTLWALAEAFPPTHESSMLPFPIDHLPLYLRAQPVCDLPDLVHIEHLITTDDVPGDDHDGDWKETMAGARSSE